MSFSEKLKHEVKKNAHFKCCLCRLHWATHVHHIIPHADGGTDDKENAAPVCPTCHDLYGGNPEKRKFIAQNRDFWYDLCEKASPPNFDMIREIHEHLCKEVVTKTDLDNALRPLYNILNQNLSHSEQLQQISDLIHSISVAIDEPPITIRCPNCSISYDMLLSKCPNCSWPESAF